MARKKTSEELRCERRCRELKAKRAAVNNDLNNINRAINNLDKVLALRNRVNHDVNGVLEKKGNWTGTRYSQFDDALSRGSIYSQINRYFSEVYEIREALDKALVSLAEQSKNISGLIIKAQNDLNRAQEVAKGTPFK